MLRCGAEPAWQALAGGPERSEKAVGILALDLNALSLALFGAAALAFTRQRTLVLAVCGGLFVPVAGLVSIALYWPLSPVFALLLLCVTLGLPLLALLLYAVDVAFAAFCVEMTYPAIICWLLWPLLVLVNFLGLLVS